MRVIAEKIQAPQALKKTLSRLSRRKKIVFTNGCFDLLHRGHVQYLIQARKLGDVLVVALNGDASVRRLKGKGRPINPLEDRLAVIAALECVDYVTWFHEDTPLKTMLLLKPSFIVKGGDWDAKKMVGAHEIKTWGGKAKSLSFLKGRSTTRLMQKTQKT